MTLFLQNLIIGRHIRKVHIPIEASDNMYQDVSAVAVVVVARLRSDFSSLCLVRVTAPR